MLFDVINLLEKLSFRAMGYSSPNPPVACVITKIDGEILAYAHTQLTGENHAEREAYRLLENSKIPEHYLFVTLEPCTHFGRTPPCSDLILKHKPKKLFIGMKDPNPLVEKNSKLAEYSEIGIEVIFLEELKLVAEKYLSGFQKRILQKKPLIYLKSAISSDGFFANESRKTISLSNITSNEITNRLRAKVDAVFVGPGTVFQDSPNLNLKPCKLFQLEKIKTESFWSRLVNSISDSDETNFTNQNLNMLQPYRIFYISSLLGIKPAFIKRQRKINAANQNYKAIFIVDQNEKDKKFDCKDLFSLSDDPISIFDLKEFEAIKKKILRKLIYGILLENNINSILIEGGNFLYELFSDEADFFVEIQTQTKIKKGILPKIDKSKFSIVEEIKIESDEWKVYKR